MIHHRFSLKSGTLTALVPALWVQWSLELTASWVVTGMCPHVVTRWSWVRAVGTRTGGPTITGPGSPAGRPAALTTLVVWELAQSLWQSFPRSPGLALAGQELCSNPESGWTPLLPLPSYIVSLTTSGCCSFSLLLNEKSLSHYLITS